MNFFEFTKYLKIVNYEWHTSLDRTNVGLINYQPYDFQKRLIEHLQNNQFTILKKFRDGGFSTTIVLYLLWRCLYIADQKILLVSKTDREANSQIVSRAIENLPENLRPKMNIDNDHIKEFVNTSSKMMFFNTSGARGRASNCIVVDEAAFIPDMENHWSAIYPTLQPTKKDLLNYEDYAGFLKDIEGGNSVAAYALVDYLLDEDKINEANCLSKFLEPLDLPNFLNTCCPSKLCKIIICSTPNGQNNWFHKTYNDAVSKENKFSIFESSYTESPRNPNLSIDTLKENLGERGFRSEIFTEFI